VSPPGRTLIARESITIGTHLCRDEWSQQVHAIDELAQFTSVRPWRLLVTETALFVTSTMPLDAHLSRTIPPSPEWTSSDG
jgi:hypothetical protein